MEKTAVPTFSPYQKLVVAILAFLQFTIILDFMILSPLSAVLLPSLQMSPSQFGLVVSSYAFSAGTSGILAAGFADKYDRKRLLLFFYGGFMLGTLLCGLADSFHFLLIARIVTGIFGGVVGSIAFAIVADVFPLSMRGRVMGLIQTAFAASQVLGIPFGLYLTNHYNWHAPFLMIVGGGLIIGVVMILFLKPVDAHLGLHPDRNAFHHLLTTVQNRRYLGAFAATAMLSLGGFMLMPFGSAFTVNNLGISIDKLPIIYLVSGLFSILIGPMVGRASDRYGKFKVFLFGTIFGMLMVLIYTHLGITPLWAVITINTLMFVGIFSRMIPSQALMSAVPEVTSRGSFMAISSSMQSMAGGLGSILAGLIIFQRPDGHIEHFPTIGYILVVTSGITVVMVYRIHKMIQARSPAGAA